MYNLLKKSIVNTIHFFKNLINGSILNALTQLNLDVFHYILYS